MPDEFESQIKIYHWYFIHIKDDKGSNLREVIKEINPEVAWKKLESLAKKQHGGEWFLHDITRIE